MQKRSNNAVTALENKKILPALGCHVGYRSMMHEEYILVRYLMFLVAKGRCSCTFFNFWSEQARLVTIT